MVISKIKLAEWDDLMPFPVVDHKRYFRLAFSTGLLLVHIFLFSGFMHITIMLSQLVLDSELSKTFSQLQLLQLWALATISIDFKF